MNCNWDTFFPGWSQSVNSFDLNDVKDQESKYEVERKTLTFGVQINYRHFRSGEPFAGHSMDSMHIQPGMRVVRGPDWSYPERQNGGEGYVGTIVYVLKQDASDGIVTVVWDTGREVRYRAGQNGKYDLRIFDNATAGVIQEFITCDECIQKPIQGTRWKCTTSADFDLCTACYMKGKHDIAHRRPRTGWNCLKRDKLEREGELLPWWSEGVLAGDEEKETYRLGGGGSVDIFVTKPVKGDVYYPSQLAVVVGGNTIVRILAKSYPKTLYGVTFHRVGMKAETGRMTQHNKHLDSLC